MSNKKKEEKSPEAAIQCEKSPEVQVDQHESNEVNIFFSVFLYLFSIFFSTVIFFAGF